MDFMIPEFAWQQSDLMNRSACRGLGRIRAVVTGQTIQYSQSLKVWQRPGLCENSAVAIATYEEDVEEDPQRAYRRICRHLHLPVHESTVQKSRTNPYPLFDLIENFDVVRSLLRGTDYEWMLEDAPRRADKARTS
jgi:hypothetical protein